MSRVLVVGGGTIGRAVFAGLTYRSEVLVIDSDPDHPWELVHHCDTFFENPNQVLALHDPEYLIMAVAMYDVNTILRIVEACKQFGVHYLDFSEDVHTRAALEQAYADQDSIAIRPGCGLAPGMIQVIAQHLTEPFDTVWDIRMRVGSLPVSVSNNLMYHPMWSVDGVVNEYSNPAHSIENCNVVTNPSMMPSSLEPVIIDGIEYEAFTTSGGLGTMVDTWNGKARNVNYKTVRYPEHLRTVRKMMQAGTFRDELMLTRPTRAIEDKVVIFVEVTGVIDGEPYCNVYSKDIRGSKGMPHLSAIQRTTAGGAILAIEAQQEIGVVGMVKQEDLVAPILKNGGFLTWAGYYGD